jgi:site-specific recombinase XerD
MRRTSSRDIPDERRRLSRFVVYERVRKAARHGRIQGEVSPHRLRYTLASHLVRGGVGSLEEDGYFLSVGRLR